MVSHERPGDGATSPGPQDQGEKRHERCVRGHASGQGEVSDLGGGEERGTGVARGGRFRPAAAGAPGRGRQGARHAARPRPAPGPGRSGQAARTGGGQPAAARGGQNPRENRVSPHRSKFKGHNKKLWIV